MERMTAGMSLYEDFERVDAGLDGRLGVAVRFPDSGEEILYHADETFPSASVIKIAVLVAVYEGVRAGVTSLDDRLPLPSSRVGGSGVLQFLDAGLNLTVRDLCWLMITVSDNVATNMLIALLGVERINGTIKGFGLEHTVVNRPISFDAPGYFAETTPGDMMRLLARIDDGTAVDKDACAEMLAMLRECEGRDGIPRYLPMREYGGGDENKPPAIQIAHKTGSINGVRNDAGIVYLNDAQPPRRYIVSIFTANVADDTLWTSENVASRTVAEVSRLVYRYASNS